MSHPPDHPLIVQAGGLDMSRGLAAACVSTADPGKQGLDTEPGPTCRGHLVSGPGPGTAEAVARVLNKSSSQPGRPLVTTVSIPAGRGPRVALTGEHIQTGPQHSRSY